MWQTTIRRLSNSSDLLVGKLVERAGRCALMIALLVGPGALATSSAQPALDRLESQLRGGNLPETAGRAPSPGFLGLLVDDRQTAGNGVRVVDLMPDGPAATGGLKVGDLVTDVAVASGEPKPVRSMDDFARSLATVTPGIKIYVSVERSASDRQTFEITVGDRRSTAKPGPAGLASEALIAPPIENRGSLLGVRLAAVTPDLLRQWALPETTRGTVVVGLVEAGPAERAGLPLEAVIVSIDGQPVATPADVAQIVRSAGAGREITLGYLTRNGTGKIHECRVKLEETNLMSPALMTPPTPLQPPAMPLGTSTDRFEALERRVLELERRLSEIESAAKRAVGK